VRLWAEPAVLEGAQKVRISRDEVRAVMRMTILGCLSNGWLTRLYEAERRRLEERMSACPL
jgi:hypothetical protein